MQRSWGMNSNNSDSYVHFSSPPAGRGLTSPEQHSSSASNMIYNLWRISCFFIPFFPLFPSLFPLLGFMAPALSLLSEWLFDVSFITLTSLIVVVVCAPPTQCRAMLVVCYLFQWVLAASSLICTALMMLCRAMLVVCYSFQWVFAAHSLVHTVSTISTLSGNVGGIFFVPMFFVARSLVRTVSMIWHVMSSKFCNVSMYSF